MIEMTEVVPPPAGHGGRRPMAVLFAGSALMNAAIATASTVSSIVAADRLGDGWGGVPPTAGIVGTGIGAVLLTRLMGIRGRRAGLMLGYAAATAGAVLTIIGAAGAGTASVVAIAAGMALIGLGNGGAQLSRYAAADLYPAARRGFAIGTLVWAGAIGAVGGPLLLGRTGAAASALGWLPSTGAFVFAALAAGAALAASAAGAPGGVANRATVVRVSLRQTLRTPAARSALAVMATAQVVMVAVMTSTPIEMHRHGHGMSSVGQVISAHTIGMFVFSPVTGRLLDRYGARPLMLSGVLLLAASTGIAAIGGENEAFARTSALFLLGYAWNLCFIGGSGHLARDVAEANQAGLEGAVDGAVWGVAALASLTSTVVLSQVGYSMLSALAGALVVVPMFVLVREGGARRRSAVPSVTRA